MQKNADGKIIKDLSRQFCGRDKSLKSFDKLLIDFTNLTIPCILLRKGNTDIPSSDLNHDGLQSMLWGIFSSIRGAKRARNLVAPMYVCLGDVRQYPALLRNKYLSNGCYVTGSVPRPFPEDGPGKFLHRG